MLVIGNGNGIAEDFNVAVFCNKVCSAAAAAVAAHAVGSVAALC